MHYIIQSNLYKEIKYNRLINALQKLKLSYETVKILPFIDEYEFNNIDNNVFIFGEVKLAKISSEMGFKPGSFFGSAHDYQNYSKYYKEHLLNYDSIIYNTSDDFKFEGLKFLRPCDDNKMFNGGVYTYDSFKHIKDYLLHENKDIKIQVADIKKVFREVRLFIVGGKIVTGSQYTFGTRFMTSTLIGEHIIEFAQKMIDIYELNECFVLDIAETDKGLKIVECNCFNCSGFYESDVEKILIALEQKYNHEI